MADDRPAISDQSEQALLSWLEARGEPAYRAKQIRRSLARGSASDWEELTNLPQPLRGALATAFRWSTVEPVAEEASADGETRKALLRLRDGSQIETVLMPHHGDRNAICLSTQVGCAMACAFCATGEMGLLRNLSTAEIIDQVRHWQKDLVRRGDRVSHVVYMGMGEPLHNYAATLASVRMLVDHELFAISPRRLTISTSGLVPQIDRLATEDLPVNLAVSLHAPDDATRSLVMPVNRRWGVEAVLAAAARYVARTRRRITFEYVLLRGVNDSAAAATALAALIVAHGRPQDSHVNLIPVNAGPGGFSRPRIETTDRFAQILRDAGIVATVRISKGQDIAAGCGQLKVSNERRSGAAARV